MGRRAPSGISLLISLDQSRPEPIFLQIYSAVRHAVLSGTVRPGQQLPSTRVLAVELGVSRNTVVLAYDHLRAEGYIEGTRGAGTFIAKDVPDAPPRRPSRAVAGRTPGARPVARRTSRHLDVVLGSPRLAPEPVPFRIGEPSLAEFPVRLWSELTRKHWTTHGRALLGYGDAFGYLPLREAILEHLQATRGVKADIDQVLIVRGTQQALDLASRVLLDPGDTVVVEDPGYLAARATFEAAEARLAPAPVDDQGMDVEEARLRAPRPRLICVTPSHQFPLGVTLPLRRRLALLEWAAQAGAWVLEDDFDSEFRYVGPPLTAMQGLDDDHRVIHVGAFSKSLFPALRLGWMVVPRDLLPAFRVAHAIADHLSPTVEQAVVAEFITEGHFARHVRRMRSVYRLRQAELVRAASRELDGVAEIAPAATGMHLLAWLSNGMDDRFASRIALEAGIEAPALSTYAIEHVPAPALILGYAAIPEAVIAAATKHLGEVLRAAAITAPTRHAG